MLEKTEDCTLHSSVRKQVLFTLQNRFSELLVRGGAKVQNVQNCMHNCTKTVRISDLTLPAGVKQLLDILPTFCQGRVGHVLLRQGRLGRVLLRQGRLVGRFDVVDHIDHLDAVDHGVEGPKAPPFHVRVGASLFTSVWARHCSRPCGRVIVHVRVGAYCSARGV